MTWSEVFPEAVRIATEAFPLVSGWKKSAFALSPRAWMDLETGEIVDKVEAPPEFGNRPWLHIKKAGAPLAPVFSALQMVPNQFNGMFGGPTPLAASLAGGLLGAGLGYGAGYVGEKVLGPKIVEPGVMRRRAAMLGGAVGTLPGIYLGSLGARLNAQDGKPAMEAFVQPNVLFGKQASAGGFFDASIPVDAFNRAVWQDPLTPASVQALAAGAVNAAAQSADRPWFISPFDVGRIAVGMGGGLVSGMIAGKVFGALAGLTPAAQKVVQQTGMWAGALQQAVPLLFGSR